MPSLIETLFSLFEVSCFKFYLNFFPIFLSQICVTVGLASLDPNFVDYLICIHCLKSILFFFRCRDNYVKHSNLEVHQ